MGSRRKKTSNATLPNAPLAEVVFELRWELQQGLAGLNFDPLMFPLLLRFSSAMAESGFPHIVDLTHPMQTGPYGVVRRFYKDADSLFPLMQIGVGIFATNASKEYRWLAFRTQVLRGLKALLDVYPSKLGFPLRPNYLELRYVDVFDKAVLGNSSFFRFLERWTSLDIRPPPTFSNKSQFWGEPEGRVVIRKSLRERKESVFTVDVAAGPNVDKKETIIRLESKVVTSSHGVPVLRTPKPFLGEITKWLEFAHGVTSPFFKEFVSPEVMQKFKEN